MFTLTLLSAIQFKSTLISVITLEPARRSKERKNIIVRRNSFQNKTRLDSSDVAQKSPQTSKEEKPAVVLKLGIRRIGSENSKVRALRMVSLRNALAVFIIGDCVRRRKEKKTANGTRVRCLHVRSLLNALRESEYV